MDSIIEAFVGGAVVGGVGYIIFGVMNKIKERRYINRIKLMIAGKLTLEEIKRLILIDSESVELYLMTEDINGLVEMKRELL